MKADDESPIRWLTIFGFTPARGAAVAYEWRKWCKRISGSCAAVAMRANRSLIVSGWTAAYLKTDRAQHQLRLEGLEIVGGKCPKLAIRSTSQFVADDLRMP